MYEILSQVIPHSEYLKTLYLSVLMLVKPFPGTYEYWNQRYKKGGNSGPGSYHKLARFKAKVINDFVKEKEINSVIEYGCGDGNQLKFSQYPKYTGFDISKSAIERCKTLFSKDKTKIFKLMDDYVNEKADLTLSLEVIFHLVEDKTFDFYMRRLFESSKKYVIIYSSNSNEQKRIQPSYVKHRKFTNWIEKNAKEWSLKEFIPNKYPYDNYLMIGSYSDFYIYEKNTSAGKTN